MPGKLLKCRAKSDDFSRKLLPRFIMSDELYQSNHLTGSFSSTSTTSTSTSTDTDTDTNTETPTLTLLDLPTEILSQIYTSITTASAQVATALTCKHMAQIARNLDLNLSTTSAKYAGFLPRSVFDIPDLMQSLTPWMPSHLKLCDHCLTMRPASPVYWADVDGCEGAEFWITKAGWDFRDAHWHKRVLDICPACHLSCSLSDFVDCDGCRALGRLGDVDWSRVSDLFRRRALNRRLGADGEEGEDEGPLGEMATVNIWDANA